MVMFLQSRQLRVTAHHNKRTLMILMFLETVARTLVTLAQASWRRTPERKWKRLRWAWFYLKWLCIMLMTMLLMPRRGVVFSALYSWFRPVDDILDGEDKNQPISMSDYIDQKGGLIEHFANNSLRFKHVSGRDRLLVIILHFAESVDMKEEAQKYVPVIWEHMVTEYRWRVRKIIPTANELNEFACKQDEAIFRLAARVLGADRNILDQIDIDRSGAFTRTDWINDLLADLKTGLVHLPSEACARVNMAYDGITHDRASRAVNRSAAFRRVVSEEIHNLEALWQPIQLKREELVSAFPNRLMGTLHARIMMSELDRSWEKIKEMY